MVRYHLLIVAVLLTSIPTPAHAQQPSDRDLLPIDLEGAPAAVDTTGPDTLAAPTLLLTPEPPRLVRAWARLGLAWTPPTTFDKWALGVAEALIVVDTLMTFNFLHRPNEYITGETGLPLLLGMGNHPNDGQIMFCGALGAAATATLWYVLPDFWRKNFVLTVVAVEALNTGHMYLVGIRFSLP